MNIKEVAKKAGVSITTVSRVLNNPDMVSEETKNRILNVMDELHYTPNWFARNLQTSKTHVIGMLVPDTLEQPYMEITKGVEKIARQKSYSIILCSTEFSSVVEREQITTLTERNIDGLILTSSALEPEDFHRLHEQEIPFVLVGKSSAARTENTVYTDYDTAAETAIRYLLDMGRKNIAVILSGHPRAENEEKLAGYKRALTEYGLRYDDANIIETDNTLEGGYVATSRLLESPHAPDAIFAATDTMAFGAIEKIKEDGLTPDDVAIIGFDDLKVGAVMEPKLTTVSKPSYRMGLTAARLLFDLIEDDSLSADPQSIMLQSKLKIRKSCGNKKRVKEIW